MLRCFLSLIDRRLRSRTLSSEETLWLPKGFQRHRHGLSHSRREACREPYTFPEGGGRRGCRSLADLGVVTMVIVVTLHDWKTNSMVMDLLGL